MSLRDDLLGVMVEAAARTAYETWRGRVLWEEPLWDDRGDEARMNWQNETRAEIIAALDAALGWIDENLFFAVKNELVEALRGDTK